MHGLKKIIAGLEKRYKFYTLLCPFLMIAEVFMETLIPYLMAMIIDTGIAQKNIGFVLNKGLIMIFLRISFTYWRCFWGKTWSFCGGRLCAKSQAQSF